MKSMKGHEGLSPGLWGVGMFVRSPFQPDGVCLRVLRQGALLKQASPRPLLAPTL